MCIFIKKTLLWTKPDIRSLTFKNVQEILEKATRKSKKSKSVGFEFKCWPYLVIDSSLLKEPETSDSLKDFDKLFYFTVKKEARFKIFGAQIEETEFVLYDFTGVGVIY